MFLEFKSQSFTSAFGMQNTPQALPVPMVYENTPVEVPVWEYHILSVDTSDEPLPKESQLNDLGRQGWVLVSVLNVDNSSRVHYYFVRQANR